MKRSSYGEPDYAFGQAMLTLRTAARLTQVEVARRLGVSRKAVGEWETGRNYPQAAYLQAFITLSIEKHAFPVGREEEQIRALWQAAHRKLPLDETWLSELLANLEAPSATPAARDRAGTAPAHPQELGPRVDWGDALAVTNFYGRGWESNLLARWIVQERCRVVSVLGLGGIGKSALATQVMHQLASHFEVVIWHSVRDAPSCQTLLDECLRMLAPQALQNISIDFEQRLSLLLERLRQTRVLLVLDNLETLLEEGQSTGHMRPGYEGYGQLLRRMAETAHQSCLLLTSREKPSDLVPHEGNHAPVRVLRLARLDPNACEQLLIEKGIAGSLSEHEQLIEAYAGNPLALKIVTETIMDLFAGEITLFLEQNEVVFGGVRELLSEQYVRLSTVEQTLLLWLAILREPVSMEELLAVLATPLPRGQVLDAVESLRRRSLIELGQRPGTFTLQAVVLEYATAQLIAEVASEIEQQQLNRLTEHGLELATAKEYVRQTQERLIVTPLLAQLRYLYRERAEVEKHLLSLLDQLRAQAEYAQGYGPANVLALLRLQCGHLRGLNLSQLSIWRAALHGVEMQDASLAGASLRETVLNEVFDIPWAVAISLDGQYWAAGSRRGEVRVWREEGRQLHLAWQAHNDTIRALAFSPDGQTLATGSWDGTIKLWNIENGAHLWTSWVSNNAESLTFAPDGHTLASSGDNATINLWDATSGAHRQTLSGQGGPVFALAWSPDGRLLASGGMHGGIQLWDLSRPQQGTVVGVLTGHTHWVLGLAFTPDSTLLASGSWDTTVKLWDVETRRLLLTLTGHTDRVRAVTWSPDGRLLASCGFDNTIWLWDQVRGSYQTGLHGHTAGVYGIAFTPDSRHLLSSSEDSTLRVWDAERGQCTHIMQSYAVSLYDVAWSPDGRQLVSAGSNMLVTIWEAERQLPPRLLRGHRSLVCGVAWSPDGKWLASCGFDNTIQLWDAATGETRQILRNPEHANTLFYDVAWSPDGTRLVSTSYQHGIQVWETATWTLSWVGREQLTRIRRASWSPDGTHLASCGDDGSIFLWKTTDGTVSASLQGQAGMIMSVAWSPDSTLLASAGGMQGSGVLSIWNVQTEQRLQVWSEPTAMLNTLAWSPTGAMLLSGSSDGSVRWWDVQSGKCLRLRQGHQGAVQSLCVSPRGDRLASCGDDNLIQLWDLQSGAQLQTLRHDRPYERIDITGIKGLTEAQHADFRALGAVEGTNAEK